MPGSRIPNSERKSPAARETRLRHHPAWNLKLEVTKQLDYIRAWGGRFVTAVPALQVDG